MAAMKKYMKMKTHHVFYGQLEGRDLPDDLIVSLHLVHTLRQVLETNTHTHTQINSCLNITHLGQ